MNLNEAKEQEKWRKKPCAHPSLDRLEVTDEYVCEVCGTTGLKETFDNLKKIGK